MKCTVFSDHCTTIFSPLERLEQVPTKSSYDQVASISNNCVHKKLACDFFFFSARDLSTLDNGSIPQLTFPLASAVLGLVDPACCPGLLPYDEQRVQRISAGQSDAHDQGMHSILIYCTILILSMHFTINEVSQPTIAVLASEKPSISFGDIQYRASAWDRAKWKFRSDHVMFSCRKHDPQRYV